MEMPEAIRNAAPTATRVEESTAQDINERIHQRTEATLARAAADRQSIEQRLRELDQEWDIERVLQTNFAIINLTGITLGSLVFRPWYLLTGIAAGFMIEHALKGWCPPVPIFRRMGFRTAREIDRERYALKALRGDFKEVGEPGQAFRAATGEPDLA